jgi:hypothetical protein
MPASSRPPMPPADRSALAAALRPIDRVDGGQRAAGTAAGHLTEPAAACRCQFRGAQRYMCSSSQRPGRRDLDHCPVALGSRQRHELIVQRADLGAKGIKYRCACRHLRAEATRSCFDQPRRRLFRNRQRPDLLPVAPRPAKGMPVEAGVDQSSPARGRALADRAQVRLTAVG